jgi:hypothetical protein
LRGDTSSDTGKSNSEGHQHGFVVITTTAALITHLPHET